jgi:hypothetical protein
MTSIHMVLPQVQLTAFAQLLQRGVWVRTRVGCHVLGLLTGQFGIDRDYVEGRITTLFLDAKAVDVLETTYVRDGSVLALSAAMPGLVGATMRRGSHLATMRGNMTYQVQDLEDKAGLGWVRVKLFNLVLFELGGLFLQRGIWLQGGDLAELLFERPENFWQSFRSVSWDDRQIEPSALKRYVQKLGPQQEVQLSVEFSD